ALTQLAEIPIALDKFHEGRMLAINMGDVTAPRERRDRDHGNTWTRAEEVDRLNEAGIIITATFVHGDEDCRAFPLLLVALCELDDVLGEGFEQIELRRRGVTVQGAVRLDV